MYAKLRYGAKKCTRNCGKMYEKLRYLMGKNVRETAV